VAASVSEHAQNVLLLGLLVSIVGLSGNGRVKAHFRLLVKDFIMVYFLFLCSCGKITTGDQVFKCSENVWTWAQKTNISEVSNSNVGERVLVSQSAVVSGQYWMYYSRLSGNTSYLEELKLPTLHTLQTSHCQMACLLWPLKFFLLSSHIDKIYNTYRKASLMYCATCHIIILFEGCLKIFTRNLKFTFSVMPLTF